MAGLRRFVARFLCAFALVVLTMGMFTEGGAGASTARSAGTHSTPVLADEPPTDSDGDGITDDVDACPTEPGVPDFAGCPYVYIPVDTDGDGVNDDTDQCPVDAGSATYNGCPAPDSDGDGLADDADACPTLPGPYDGCPLVDFDGDGVTDDIDNCPNQPGPADRNGCPVPDSDNDGVTDDTDQCGSTPTGATVDQNGCAASERDTDGDGVTDDVDNCVTVVGPANNAGCPIIKVKPAPVTFSDQCGTRNDTTTVPATTGVTYLYRGKAVPAGRYVTHGWILVAARANKGYVLSGKWLWTRWFSARGCRGR